MILVVVTMARAVRCSLCDADVPLPALVSGTDAIWAVLHEHLRDHAREVEAGLDAHINPTCARCKRVPLAGDLPHRPCFDAECHCPCSYSLKENA